jgi:hypothetical protein
LRLLLSDLRCQFNTLQQESTATPHNGLAQRQGAPYIRAMRIHTSSVPAMPAGRTPLEQPEFLPMTAADVKHIGWDGIDILLVTGDGYVDHPSFAAAILGRWLVAHGYRVGVAAQPAWDSTADLEKMGRPALFAGVTAGALDSMLAHYTAFRKKRSDDAYTPGGKAGARPNRATIVYTNLVRRAFPGLPVILGGIEASLRRITHYDFWTDKLRRPLLLDSKADAIIYGMGERAMLEAAVALDENGYAHQQDTGALPPLWTVFSALRGMACMVPADYAPAEADVFELPAHEAIEKAPHLLLQATVMLEKQVHAMNAPAIQPAGGRKVHQSHSGNGYDADFSHHTPRLRGRMLILFTGAPSGQAHCIAQPQIGHRRGAGHDPPCRLERHHKRCGRTERQHVAGRMRGRPRPLPQGKLHAPFGVQGIQGSAARRH